MGNNRYEVMFVLLNLIFFISCKNVNSQNNSVIVSDDQIVVQDSISPYGDLIKVYDTDSLYAYNQNGILKYIEYLDLNSPVRLKLYSKDGFLKRIEYNTDNPNPTLVVAEEFYLESGNLRYRESIPDSSWNRGVDRRKEYFYENGNLEHIESCGSVSAKNGPVGLQKYYSENGNLIRSENYVYPIAGRPYIVEVEYYEYGIMRSKKQFYNNKIYDSDEIEPKGAWKYYNEKGKLVETEKY